MTATRAPHEVLGVPEGAPPDEVRRAYKKAVLRYHPDRNPGDQDAAEAFLSAQAAFEALDTPDPDAGFDAERVAREMQKAAEEATRRRRGGGLQGRAWQQARVLLDRPRTDEIREALQTPRALAGLGLGLALGVAGVALAPAWAVAAVGVGVGLAVGAVLTAPTEPWAVETHWQGLRDSRWDVLVSWAEIRDLREGPGRLDLALTPQASARLGEIVGVGAFAEPGVYRLPIPDPARLAVIVRSQIGAPQIVEAS